MARSTAAPRANGAAGMVRSYIAAQPARTARELRKLRAAIRAVAPGAVEAFGYGIPGFRLYDEPLVWYAGWTYHTSLYPMTAAIRRRYADELKGYKMATGTIQFPLSEPLPLPLVKRLVKARVAEVRAGRAAKAAKAPKVATAVARAKASKTARR